MDVMRLAEYFMKKRFWIHSEYIEIAAKAKSRRWAERERIAISATEQVCVP